MVLHILGFYTKHCHQSWYWATQENHSHCLKFLCCICQSHQEKHSSRWLACKDLKDEITWRGEDRVRAMKCLRQETFPVLRSQSHRMTAQGGSHVLKIQWEMPPWTLCHLRDSIVLEGGSYWHRCAVSSCLHTSAGTSMGSPLAWKPTWSHPQGPISRQRDCSTGTDSM